MATTGDRSIFLDSNVLVYANVAEAPLHAVSLAKIKYYHESGWEIWISPQVIREFLVVRTRPQNFSGDCSIETLIERVEYFRRTFRMALDTPATLDKLTRLLTEIKIGGKQIHDANIVASMMTYGVKNLLTHNVSDFNRYASLITVVPLVN